jgi:hypothetical protein
VTSKHEIDREELVERVIVRHYILRGTYISALKVHKQWPVDLLVDECLLEGKALGSEELEGLKIDFVVGTGKTWSWGSYCL